MNPKNCDNQNAFLELVRAGLWEQDARLLPFGEVNYDEVMRLAEEQSVVGLVTAGLEQVRDVRVPQEELLQFIGQTLQLEQNNTAMNKFVAELISKMRKEGIYALLLKGQGVAQCYIRPKWRACGDVDLFLSDDNYDRAKRFLEHLASTVEKEYIREKHLGMTINDWVVELHGSLYCGLSTKIERELDEVRKDTFYGGAVRSWDNSGMQVFMLKAENDAFYVFTHILQHFYKEGVGMRQLCDWCRLLWTYRESLNYRLLESRIRKAGLMNEWRAFGAYAVEYLGMPVDAMPFYSTDKKWKRKAARINKYILSVGNMGHNRDKSYVGKYPYLIRKGISMARRIGDLFHHALLFPVDSLIFFPKMMLNGLMSAARGE